MTTKLKPHEVVKLNAELAPQGQKFCNAEGCQQVKSVGEFSPKKRGGYENHCKPCSVRSAQKWQAENIDRYRESQRVSVQVRTQGGRDPVKPWPEGFVSYYGAHHRVRYTYGPARNYPCVDCGEPADDWSYIGGCPDEFSGPVRNSNGITCFLHWSGDPKFYVPRCRPDHAAHDRARRTAIESFQPTETFSSLTR